MKLTGRVLFMLVKLLDGELTTELVLQDIKAGSLRTRLAVWLVPGLKQLASGELDPEQRYSTTALLAEILFPNADHTGAPGLDLVEAEAMAPTLDAGAKDVLARMDLEEAAFAMRLRELMDAKGLTQAQLAERVGIGQPAISMMLNRTCRPQRKTVLRFAQALGVAPEELWPHRPE